VLVLAAWSLPCRAAENAVLRNGFSITHERRKVIGEITRLYLGKDNSSFVDVATDDIDHFEEAPAAPVPIAEPAPVPPAPASAAQPASVTAAPAAGLKIATGPAAGKGSKVDLSEVVDAASGRYRLDPDLVNSVIKAESGFNVRAVSPKGARGLMQLMPQTASELGVQNAFDPKANVDGGTRYLRELLERYNFDLIKALAAYNAGPQRVEQYGGVPPYYETRAYVARIVKDFNKKKTAQEKAAQAQPKGSKGEATKARTTVAPRQNPDSAVRTQSVQAAASQASE
jgi:soluble lytic murein transglycosylase-like protein